MSELLLAAARRHRRPPLEPADAGGGRPRSVASAAPGISPNTVDSPPWAWVAELAEKDYETRRQQCLTIRRQALAALEPLEIRLHGNQARVVSPCAQLQHRRSRLGGGNVVFEGSCRHFEWFRLYFDKLSAKPRFEGHGLIGRRGSGRDAVFLGVT